jgi:transaldolase
MQLASQEFEAESPSAASAGAVQEDGNTLVSSVAVGEMANAAATRDASRAALQVDRPLQVAIFADGADLTELLQTYRGGLVRGFTTNPTLMRKAGVANYELFAKSLLAEIRDLPISFEVFADDFPEMERQAREIASWGPNVFVKVPITNTNGESSIPLVGRLVEAGVKVNVTAILTVEKVEAVARVLSPALSALVSVFAGRIADTGRDPMPIMQRAAEIVSGNPNARLVWASPREVLNVYQADACGCHVITMTKALLDKLPMRGMDLDLLSRDTVKMFYSDAQGAGYSIRSAVC